MDNELKVKITTESSGVDQGMQDASDKVARSVSSMRSSFSSLGGTIASLKNNWAMLSIGINQALEIFNKAIQIPRQMVEWAEMGAVVMRTETAFNQVAQAAGYAGDEIVKSLVKASGGAMDASDTMQRAGRLMQEGLRPDQLVSMMELLRKQAPVVGDTIQEAWDKIGAALTTGNMRMVKQYVGLVDLEKELSRYAATLGVTKDRLTEEAKQGVIFETVHRALINTTKDLKTNTESYSDSMARSKATIKSAWEDIYKSMVPVGDLLLKIAATSMGAVVAQPPPATSAFLAGSYKYREQVKGRQAGAQGAEAEEASLGMAQAAFVPAKAVKSPIAERTPEQAAAFNSFRLKNEADMLTMQNDLRGAIVKRQQAELAGELEKEKRVELARRHAIELAEFDKNAAYEVARANIEAKGIEIDERQKQEDEAARVEADQRKKSNEDEQKMIEETIVIRGEALDRENAMVAEAIQRDFQTRKDMEARGLQNTIQNNQAATETAMEYYRNRFELGEINAQELARIERELEEQRFQIELKGLEDLSNLYISIPEKYQEVLNQILAAKERHAADMNKIDAKLAKDTRHTWAGIVAPIRNALDTSVKGIIMGTQTLQQGLNNLWQNILASYINMLIQMGLRWVEQQLFELVFGQAIQTESATSRVISDSAVAAVAAMASVAAIPYWGWAAAPGVAAQTYALGMSFLPSAVAEGGWDVDRDALTQVHAKEMILPADLAGGVRNLVTEGGSRQDGVRLDAKMFRAIGKSFGRGQGLEFSRELRSAVRRIRK